MLDHNVLQVLPDYVDQWATKDRKDPKVILDLVEDLEDRQDLKVTLDLIMVNKDLKDFQDLKDLKVLLLLVLKDLKDLLESHR